MRIAYLAQSYPPMISGAAIFVRDIAEAMAASGHQVLVIAASDRGQPYVILDENIRILRLRSFHNPMRVGQRILPYPRHTILKALHEFAPDIIHAHEPLISWVGFEYARSMNIPITLTMHMLPWFVSAFLPDMLKIRAMAEAIGWMYVRLMTRKFTSVITTTKTTADVVTSRTGVQAKTISCGINMRTFRPPLPPDLETGARTRLNLPLNVPVILHVGRLDTEKRVDRVVQAAAQAMSQSDAHLLIVGDGREKHALIKLSQSVGIADRVHFPGFISVNEGLPEIYRLASLFVMASEIESQGIVLLEAAASGLPIVAVDATSISEIVHDGINGYLTSPGDVQALGDAITTLLQSPERSKQMGGESRRLAENYDIRHTRQLHEQYYGKLIEQTSRLGRKDNLYARWKRVMSWLGFSK